MPAPISWTCGCASCAQSSGAARSAPPPSIAVSPSAAIKLMQRMRSTSARGPLWRYRRRCSSRMRLCRLCGDPGHYARRAPGRAAAALRCHDELTIHNALHRLGLRHKKDLRRPRAATSRASAALAVWQRFMTGAFVFLDETHRDHMQALWPQPIGTRLLAAVPPATGHADFAVSGNRIVAPLVLDGPMTGAAFRSYVANSWRTPARRRRLTISLPQSPHTLAAAVLYPLFLAPLLAPANPISSFPSSSAPAQAAARTRMTSARHRPPPRHCAGRQCALPPRVMFY